MIVYLLLATMWVVYSSIFGYCDAYYWYSANVGKYCLKDFKFKDLHPYYFWSRSIVALAIGYGMSDGTIFNWTSIVFFLGMIFPFLHNGFYYKTRNHIDPTKYPLGFRDMSTTSIANVNFTFTIRTLMFVIGVLGLVLCK